MKQSPPHTKKNPPAHVAQALSLLVDRVSDFFPSSAGFNVSAFAARDGAALRRLRDAPAGSPTWAAMSKENPELARRLYLATYHCQIGRRLGHLSRWLPHCMGVDLWPQ